VTPGAGSRMLFADVYRSGVIGLRTRRTRAVLSALGIGIGIASMVAVLGLSESSRADLLAALDRLGTNLLRVEPGQELFSGQAAVLPDEAPSMIARLDDVERVSAVSRVPDVTARRTDLISENETNGITVMAADDELPETLNVDVAEGRFLDEAASRYPVVVLGHTTAERLGVYRVTGTQQIHLGDRWFTVVGILGPAELSPEIDRAALIGYRAARRYFDSENEVSTVLVRAHPDNVTAVSQLMGRAANPEHPEEVSVDRPSDALEARAAAKEALTSLFLGLGAVALLVGGVGIANVMVISVLERRSEIGLRRALGAARRHIRWQFMTEALVLSGAGGVAGAALGVLITAGYAAQRGWEPLIPVWVVVSGIGASLLIGSVAGLYPAVRAARLSPTEALRSV
jgi:putative ABC transport system permease protein